eukprot:Amastigsp_a512484_49.p4 type:complete len:151 gc:universal Amastigsp_a512484_49:100-552(+)
MAMSAMTHMVGSLGSRCTDQMYCDEKIAASSTTTCCAVYVKNSVGSRSTILVESSSSGEISITLTFLVPSGRARLSSMPWTRSPTSDLRALRSCAERAFITSGRMYFSSRRRRRSGSNAGSRRRISSTATADSDTGTTREARLLRASEVR